MERSNFGGVRKLDEETSTLIRKSEIIAKISDVVRELVENAIDAQSTSIKIRLENNGFTKIEVQDNGGGIEPSEILGAVSAGCTSKLDDESILSCQNNNYGFRGEALSAICALGDLTICSKPHKQPYGIRYILDQKCKIKDEKKVAIGNGTCVTVRNIFGNIPVRKQHLSVKKHCQNEMKLIQDFLNSVAISNPSVHIHLSHNGDCIVNKPSVKSIEQAILTIFGVEVAKKMGKCEELLNIQSSQSPSGSPEENNNISQKRKLELHLPKSPLDYKNTAKSYNNQYTMIFVNNKRVYIKEFEKLIKSYFLAAVSREKFTHGELTKYPIAILLIKVPPNEADFNREIDKSRVFLVHKAEIGIALERLLKTFYNIDLNADPSPSTTTPENENVQENNQISVNEPESTAKLPQDVLTTSSTSTESITTDRHNVIQNFMSGVSPTKISTVTTNQKTSEENQSQIIVANFNLFDFMDMDSDIDDAIPIPPLPQQNCNNQIPVVSGEKEVCANFNINIDDIVDGEVVEAIPLRPEDNSTININAAAESLKNVSSESTSIVNKITDRDWAEGRVKDANGNIICGPSLLRNNAPSIGTANKENDKVETPYEKFQQYLRSKSMSMDNLNNLPPNYPNVEKGSRRRINSGSSIEGILPGSRKRARSDSISSIFSPQISPSSSLNNSIDIERANNRVVNSLFGDSRRNSSFQFNRSLSSQSPSVLNSTFPSASATSSFSRRFQPKQRLFDRNEPNDPKQITLESLKNWSFTPRSQNNQQRKNSAETEPYSSNIPEILHHQQPTQALTTTATTQVQKYNVPYNEVQFVGILRDPNNNSSNEPKDQLVAIKIKETLGIFNSTKFLDENPLFDEDNPEDLLKSIFSGQTSDFSAQFSNSFHPLIDL